MSIEYNTEYNEILTKVESYKSSFKTDSLDWFRIAFSDIKVGDKLIIYYYPDSQRYINVIYPKFGDVIKIDSEIQMTNDFFSEKNIERLTLKNQEIEYNASQPWCSYYGNSRGYVYDIYRLENIIEHNTIEELKSIQNTNTDYDKNGDYESYDPYRNLEYNYTTQQYELQINHNNRDYDSEYDDSRDYDSGYDSIS